MEYPPKLKRILEQELMELKEMIHNRVGPFDHQTVMAYYTDYQTKHLSKKN
jgi:protein associated with RNAse G/E